LPIQGPPGTGKTHTGAEMICTLVTQGARVGITANSHKVIRNLLDKVVQVADKREIDLRAVAKVADREADTKRIEFTEENANVFVALEGSCRVAAGTAWMWARPDAARAVDVLFVDEAAQMSLANVLAVSQAGASLVLLGDPQQLDQPTKGSHPDGTDGSALSHILGGHQTIEKHRGLFLEQTWRLHPDICRFTSETFYEGRLKPIEGLENQRVVAKGPLHGSGLRFVPVRHSGNKNSAPEEAERIEALVVALLNGSPSWIDRHGEEKPLTLDNVLIIAPYNAQVFAIRDRLPHAHVGTVDKFQGQEAPVVIYSMATSTPEEAPRGMEFLYSLNRLNVATSRAQCLCAIVASPDLFEPECRTPRQIQLANAHCRFRELAEPVNI
ncbi:MAG: AAA family ATPase, partial [Alphaproteobacteria bacterium]|nr:AAA family ATPase [Alphaproteobacteria bacterium]